MASSGATRSVAYSEIMEENSMRRQLCVLLLISSALVPAVGCVIPAYSALPQRRAEQLIYTSENLRALVQEWERFWFMDQPDHMTPWRVHGGVI